MTRRKIIAVTGARSEFDLLEPVYSKLNVDNRFDFSIIVTGAHLSENFGSTVDQVRGANLPIADELYTLLDSDQKIGRAISLGNQIVQLAISLNRLNPDIVLVVGDREEALSVTTVCAYMGVPVAHFFGGDIAKDGNIDNSVRYAASKLAHFHFPSMESHRQNLLKLGEEDRRIFVMGNPSLEKLISTRIIDKAELSNLLKFNLLEEEYLVLIQHSIVSEANIQREQILQTLNAIVESGMKCLINYPNSDAGNHEIIKAYTEYVAAFPDQFLLFQNLEREVYVNVLRNAKCLLGNSSSGLTEAPTLALPAINIGIRQKDREHGDNVIFVDNDMEQILTALKKIDSVEFLSVLNKKRNPYGEGGSSDYVVEVLAKLDIDESLIYKNITF